MANKIPFEISDYVLEKIFVDTASRQNWLNEKKIIVSVSGGGDSIALLWLCSKFFSGKIFAVHINHQIRGSESDLDEAFTKNFAQKINCEFICERVDVPNQKLKGESLEAAARRLRQQSIIKIAKKLSINKILLAHNRDDLAETVLFNLLRGTGIRGSVGITECTEIENIKFFRPLLNFRRETLREILKSREISWREDSSNYDDKYTRNFIRLKLLPLIQENINSSAIEHLANFAEDMRIIREHEDSLSEKIFNACLICEQPLTFDPQKLRALNENELNLLIRYAGRILNLKTLSRKRCDELSNLIRKGKNFIFQWCENISAVKTKGKFFIHEHK